MNEQKVRDCKHPYDELPYCFYFMYEECTEEEKKECKFADECREAYKSFVEG